MKNNPIRRKLACLLLVAAGLAGAADAQLKEKEYTLVSANDCGVGGAQPFLVQGHDYTMPAAVQGSDKARTCNFGGRVIYAFDKMDIQASYRMEVVYLADSERRQQIVADGNTVHGPVTLEKGKEQRYLIDLPKKAYAYGQLVLIFEVLSGPNAIVSEINLYSTAPRPLVPFAGERKKALKNMPAFRVDTAVNAEEVLPVYACIPRSVPGVYRPVISLNGVWKFNPAPAGRFWETAAEGDGWHPIVVPGQWSMQGFRVDSARFAGYRTAFTVPADWEKRPVRLRFDGVASESVVYVNGRKAGRHLGGMTAFELDITHLLTPGDNRLDLEVRNESVADMLGSLTQYAAHQLGGITRKVTLFTVPETYITDLRIVTDLDAGYRDADLKVFAAVKNASPVAASGIALRLSVDGLPVVLEKDLPRLAAGETWSGWLEGRVEAPLKWDNEHPNLYTLRAELLASGRISELTGKRFGFRELEISGNELLINGRAVKLRGVCRHEAHPLSGRVLTPELMRKDAELYRAANCNFIRTSHYPPAEEFLDYCDELGLFVEVEAPVCWVGHHANENWTRLDYRNPAYYPYILQANMETIHFYRNHPSVILWSEANESYWNKEFAQLFEYIKKADPTRPSTFHDQAYGGFNNQGSTHPVANIHYPGPGGYKQAAQSDRPMIYGEYCHLNVYNRSELVTDPGIRSDWALALAPTWENMYRTKGVLGGSIWSGIDDIFQLPGGKAVGYGPWGPIDGWRRPKPEYWDMKKIYSPIRVHTARLEPAAELVFDVENRYTFTNFNELEIGWSFGAEAGRLAADIAPGARGQLRVAVKNPTGANELHLTFKDPRGFIADEYAVPVGSQPQNEWPAPAPERTRLKSTQDRYVVTGKGFRCEISRADGRIASLQKNGKEILCGGPYLMVLPLTGGGCYPDHNADTPVFNDLCAGWKACSVQAEKTGESVTVTVEGSYDGFEGSYTLCINANGELTARYAFRALAGVNPRQWGMVFDAPAGYNKTFWRRKGMWSVYPDDHISRPAGEADLYYAGLPAIVDPRTEPSWAWSRDFNELGSNDFRSTRRNIWYAGLKSGRGSRIAAVSDGSQHWRCWSAGDRVRFLVAGFVTAGDEMFLGGYYAPYRKPLKKGDPVEGCVLLRVE